MKNTKFEITFKELQDREYFTLAVYLNGEYFCDLSRKDYTYYWLWFKDENIESIMLDRNLDSAKNKAVQSISSLVKFITPYVAEKVYIKRRWWHL